MKIWKAFARSRRVRITCFALAGALLVASGVGLGYSVAAPTGEVPTAKYDHRGHFDYTVYLKPSILYGDVILTDEEEEEEVPMVFFRDIMTEVSLAFSYNFDCSQSLSSVTNKVVVSIIAQNPDVWQKEMTQLEELHAGTEFSVDFPLDLSHLERTVDNIEEDIGIVGRERQFIIRTVVTTTAETTLGQVIEDTFSYELPAVLTAKKLELKGDLEGSKEGYREGTRYEATGRFDYEVSLKPNKLYETDVLRSEALPVPEPPTPAQTLGPGLVYFPDIIDNIEASFSYEFLCNRPVSKQSQEVDVSATIENPGKWSKSLVLMPKTTRQGSFTIPFSMDIEYLTGVIDAIGQETGVPGTSYSITLKASVHTVAQTDVVTINEAFTQTLGATLEENTLTFDEELSGSQSGTIDGAATPGASEEGRSRAPWIICLVVALLVLGYFGWSQTRLRLVPVSAGEAEAARARKKYRQMMVDVEELPGVKPTETVIPLNTLDDLVRIADDLVKPVLHQAETGKHTYCIIDSGVRYLYVIET
ncbi:MAG TPA: DUF5305 family protein [Dehalococcoidia bacterium]|nr:DUF5305 family protein [Dehalococcoidia bacterium]